MPTEIPLEVTGKLTATPAESILPQQPQQQQILPTPEIASSIPQPPSIPSAERAEEEQEEQWRLKSILWPPISTLPSTNTFDSTSSPPSSQDLVAVPLAPSISGMEEDNTARIIQIVMQNANGPCSLLALCNILLLRHEIMIPPQRESVTYSHLSTLLVDYFLRISASIDSTTVVVEDETKATTESNDNAEAESETSAAIELTRVLELLPSTRYGLSLNPRFDSIHGFSPVPVLFRLAKIPLVHGWIADPETSTTRVVSSDVPSNDQEEREGEGEYDVLMRCGDYDTALLRIIQGEEILGEEAHDEAGMMAALSRREQWTKAEERKVHEAHLIKSFLNSTSTQLTYQGLILLTTQLPVGSLSALFRNSHLSVIYRPPAPPPVGASDLNGSAQQDDRSEMTPRLFTLVTDSAFQTSSRIVWESLEDVDGQGSEFYDADLQRSSGRGTRSNGNQNDRRIERGQVGGEEEELDAQLARQLQLEEDREFDRRDRDVEQDRRNRTVYTERTTTATTAGQNQAVAEETSREGRREGRKEKPKKPKKDRECCVM